VNGKTGTAPIEIEATVGQPVVLDAAGTTDPDGQPLTYSWIYYGEAGTGIPDLPVRVRRRPPAAAAPARAAYRRRRPAVRRSRRPV
jgi:hypothetical protein